MSKAQLASECTTEVSKIRFRGSYIARNSDKVENLTGHLLSVYDFTKECKRTSYKFLQKELSTEVSSYTARKFIREAMRRGVLIPGERKYTYRYDLERCKPNPKMIISLLDCSAKSSTLYRHLYKVISK